MHPRMIRTIYRKDLFDAIRDFRVLMAIVMPLGIGVFYNVIFNNLDRKPTATVAVYAAGQSALPEALRQLVSGAVDVELVPADNEADLRDRVVRKRADLGLLIPAGFDVALKGGDKPTLTVVQREGGLDTAVGARVVSQSLERVLQLLAGQQPPATIRTDSIATGEPPVFERLGLTKYFVIASIIMLIGFIGMLAVPMILAEETEKKTIDALVLVASYPDVVVAKALVGLTYVAVCVPLLLVLTRLRPADPATFLLGVGLLAVTLVGCGLLLGVVFRNANQINTWSGLFLMPVVGPAFAVGFPTPGPLPAILAVLPSSRAAELAINGMSGETLFARPWLGALVIAAWGVAAYALLLWRLARREA